MAEEQPKKHSKKQRRKKWLVSLPIVAAVLVIGLLVFSVATYVKYNVVPSGAAFTIDGRAYSQEEVKEIVSYPVKTGEMTPEKATKQAFEMLKRKRTAEKLQIDITNEAVSYNKKELFPENSAKQKSQWGGLVAYNDLLEAQLTENSDSKKMNDQVVGYAFIFLFGHCIEKGPDFEPDCLNDQKQIKKDRDYAKERAEHYRAKLQSGSITPKKALEEIQKDPRLGFMQTAGANPSAQFENFQTVGTEGVDTDVTVGSGPLEKSVEDYIRSGKIQEGLSQIMEGKTVADAVADQNDAKNWVPTYYFFTDVSTLSKAVTKQQFNEELKKLPARFKGLSKEVNFEEDKEGQNE